MLHKRNASLDAARGAALVSMIAYHACWDLVYLFGLDWGWYRSFGAYLWQQSICWTFILLSGYCWNLGRRHLRRGATVFAAGALVTAVTTLAMPDSRVFCGILTLQGTCMLLTIPLDRLLRRVPARAGLAGSFTLFLLLRDVNSGFLGFEGARVAALPAGWYRSLATACLGFPPEGFASTDYFSLVPWLFLFLTGYFLFRLRPEEGGAPLSAPAPLVWLGRRSLLIYLLHQPLVYAALLACRTLGCL